MLTEKFDLYKKLYKEYVLHLVEMHNQHIIFLRHASKESGMNMRNQLRKMIKIEKILYAASLAAVKEHEQNIKNEKARKKQERQQARQRKTPTKSKIDQV
jgi:hypothetical protein